MERNCLACRGKGRNEVQLHDHAGEATGKRGTTLCVICGGSGKVKVLDGSKEEGDSSKAE